MTLHSPVSSFASAVRTETRLMQYRSQSSGSDRIRLLGGNWPLRIACRISFSILS